MTTDQRIKEAYSRFSDLAGEGEHCPDPGLLWSSATGELDPEETAEVMIHVGECAPCGMAWRIARDLEDAPAEVAAEAPARRSRLRTWVPLLAAAAALVVVAGGLWTQFRKMADAPPPVLRTQQVERVESLLDESVPLPRTLAVLRWSAGEVEARFNILVTDETGETIARGYDLEAAEFTVPVESLDGVESGGRILWQVTAQVADGRTIRSDTFIAVIE
jgi:hypothetical protein